VAFDLTGNGQNVMKFGYGMYSMPIATSSLFLVNRHGKFGGPMYSWVGAENPTESQLKDPANWTLFFNQFSEPDDVDPKIKPNKTNKLLLEFDRRLGANWALKFRGIYSHSKNLIDDVAIYDPGTLSEMKLVITNFEYKRRNYRALEVELNGRIPGLLTLNTSYTWSQSKGTNPGDAFEAVTWDFYGGGYYDASMFGQHPLMPEGAANKALYDQIYAGLGGRGIGDEGWYGFLP
jgi:hypothetical protein